MSTPNPRVDQFAVPLDLGWHEGDPISLAWTVEDEDGVTDLDWSGVYQVQIRERRDRTSALLATLDMHGTHSGIVTDFTLSGDVADSAGVPAGTWWWDAQEVGGITRFAGQVFVEAEVTG